MHTKQWSPREKFLTWKRRSLDTFQKVVRVTTTGILVSKLSRVDVANQIAVPKSRNEIFLGGLFSGLAHGLDTVFADMSVLAREGDRASRKLREAVEIRNLGSQIN